MFQVLVTINRLIIAEGTSIIAEEASKQKVDWISNSEDEVKDVRDGDVDMKEDKKEEEKNDETIADDAKKEKVWR